MTDHWDDLMSVEHDLKNFAVLVDVTADLVIETKLSSSAAPVDHANRDNWASMMWIMRDLVTKLQKDMCAATDGLAAERTAKRGAP